MKTFNILKKNRKYFAATCGNYKCKILIDQNSDDLPIGESTLEVEDISVRTKYGTDLIFKLAASMGEQADAGICTLKTDGFNADLVEKCRALDGKYDKSEQVWVFSGLVSEEVEKLDEKYNSDKVAVSLTFTEYHSVYHDAVSIFGFPLARAFGRDSGAIKQDGVAVLSGGFRSGGSAKNWRTCVEEGTVIRMYLPNLLLNDDHGIDGLIIERI